MRTSPGTYRPWQNSCVLIDNIAKLCESMRAAEARRPFLYTHTAQCLVRSWLIGQRVQTMLTTACTEEKQKTKITHPSSFICNGLSSVSAAAFGLPACS